MICATRKPKNLSLISVYLCVLCGSIFLASVMKGLRPFADNMIFAFK